MFHGIVSLKDLQLWTLRCVWVLYCLTVHSIAESISDSAICKANVLSSLHSITEPHYYYVSYSLGLDSLDMTYIACTTFFFHHLDPLWSRSTYTDSYSWNVHRTTQRGNMLVGNTLNLVKPSFFTMNHNLKPQISRKVCIWSNAWHSKQSCSSRELPTTDHRFEQVHINTLCL